MYCLALPQPPPESPALPAPCPDSAANLTAACDSASANVPYFDPAVYFHPTLNPLGIPPPGKPQKWVAAGRWCHSKRSIACSAANGATGREASRHCCGSPASSDRFVSAVCSAGSYLCVVQVQVWGELRQWRRRPAAAGAQAAAPAKGAAPAAA
jgi:hypothetical protein